LIFLKINNFNFYIIVYRCWIRGRSKGGGEQVGARALGRRPSGRISTLFVVILSVFLSRNLDQSMLKMHIFWKKTLKFVSASGAEPPNPRLPPAAGSSAPIPRVVTPACYYNSVNFVSSAKCIFPL